MVPAPTPERLQEWTKRVLTPDSRLITTVLPGEPTREPSARDTRPADLSPGEFAPPEPVTFVCHSLGCWALDHLLAERGPRRAHAALLVAPPSPHLIFEPVESFLPPPRRPQAWAPLAARTLLVGSDNDDFSTAEELAAIAAGLGVGWRLLPGAGHINVASGHGPWPFALDWLARVGAL